MNSSNVSEEQDAHQGLQSPTHHDIDSDIASDDDLNSVENVDQSDHPEPLQVPAQSAGEIEIDLNKAFFPVKGNPHQMVCVRQPVTFIAKMITKDAKTTIVNALEDEIQQGDDSKVTKLVNQDAPKIPRAPRRKSAGSTKKRSKSASTKKKTKKTKKREREDADGDDDVAPATDTPKKTKKPTNCKWCKTHGFEGEAEGHNSRGCKRRKQVESPDGNQTKTNVDISPAASVDGLMTLQSAAVEVAAAE